MAFYRAGTSVEVTSPTKKNLNTHEVELCYAENFIELYVYELLTKIYPRSKSADRPFSSLFQKTNLEGLRGVSPPSWCAIRCLQSYSTARHLVSIADIKAALHAEIGSRQKYAVFKIAKITPVWNSLLIEIQGKPTRAALAATSLTEDFAHAGACWYGPAGGSATVSRVHPNTSEISLVNVKKNHPQMGHDLLLYPQDYITPVLRLWEEDEWAKKAIVCLDQLRGPKVVKSKTLSAEKYPFLRPAQRLALDLVTHSCSFLFGPPGTGKTFIVALTAAEFLVSNPFARVLLVSTTNQAVDQALIAADKFCELQGKTGLRRQLRRFGNGYDRNQYAEREHLLSQNCGPQTTNNEPVNDEHGNDLPSFKQDHDGDPVGTVRLYAMTIASSIARISSLRELGLFDLIIFDEASQISLAQALLVMPLGKASLFAGDPEQLAPIATSNTPSAQRWLTRSAFAFMPTTGPSRCFLNEQSRMAGPICRIPSEIFYRGLLRVADDALADPVWLKSRTLPLGHIPANEHVCIQHIDSGATRSRDRNGWFRLESAQRIIELVLSALKDGHANETDIIIITPYRLQRAYLQKQLSMLGVPKIKVSTVHSCQGSEATFIIFDPVCGNDEFLKGQGGRKLINVAISRAQAKLVLMLSLQDLKNPIFSQMVEISKRATDLMAEILHIPQAFQA